MARRKRHEEHENHEAWAIPYGDLVTLLLAFFVVMYAMSSVNEGKYRVLSDSLTEAFNGTPHAAAPHIGQTVRADRVESCRCNQVRSHDRGRRCRACGSRRPPPTHVRPMLRQPPTDEAKAGNGTRAGADRRPATGARRCQRPTPNSARSPTMSAARMASADRVRRRYTCDGMRTGCGRHQHRHPVRQRRRAAVERRGTRAAAPGRRAQALAQCDARRGHTDDRPINTAAFPPTGSCRRRAPPAWCICSWTAASRPSAWRWSASVSTGRCRQRHRGRPQCQSPRRGRHSSTAARATVRADAVATASRMPVTGTISAALIRRRHASASSCRNMPAQEIE